MWLLKRLIDLAPEHLFLYQGLHEFQTLAEINTEPLLSDFSINMG